MNEEPRGITPRVSGADAPRLPPAPTKLRPRDSVREPRAEDYPDRTPPRWKTITDPPRV